MSNPHLKPVDMAFLHDTNETYVFIEAASIQAELAALDACLDDVAPADKPIQDQLVEISAFVLVSTPLLISPSPEGLKQLLAQFSSDQLGQIRSRLNQLKRALLAACYIEGNDYDRTSVFAVSPHWNKRWSDLLLGRLLPAYIGYVFSGDLT